MLIRSKKNYYENRMCLLTVALPFKMYKITNEKTGVTIMQLGWIDFSATERSKVLGILDLLSEKATLDELGISPIRDGFSNRFFPGTSTIQTRAKYFFIVPYAMKSLEKTAVTSSVFKKDLDEREKSCGYRFLENDPNEDGVIGKRSLNKGKWVKRPPSDIYWAGLRTYGIFSAGKMSKDECINAVCNQLSVKNNVRFLGNSNDNSEENETDDKHPEELSYSSFWNIPTFKPDWFSTLKMELTKDEAHFLKFQIIKSCPDSIMGYILSHNMKSFAELESFEDIGALISQFPEDMQNEYYLAGDFSRFIYVARVLFNLIIDPENEIAIAEYDRLYPQLKELSEVDLEAIYQLLKIKEIGLIGFLNDLKKLMIEGNTDKMKSLIKKRESWLKGDSRAKTMHPEELEPGWYGGGLLDYRFTAAKQIIADIFSGEEEGNA